jgi:hypothetical protein
MFHPVIIDYIRPPNLSLRKFLIAGTLYFICFYEGFWTSYKGLEIAGIGKSDHICQSFCFNEALTRGECGS